MSRSYSAETQALSPAKLPRKTLADIGRLVRAFADIEDLVNLYICNLAQISESRALVLLGKAALTRRLEMAEYLAQMTGVEIATLQKQLFNSIFREALECRNSVVHGILLGKTAEEEYAFLTSKTEPPTGASAIQVAITYNAESISGYARLAEDAVPKIEKLLKLEGRRAKRLQQPLLPHRKARPPRKPSSKPKRQPRPSQG